MSKPFTRRAFVGSTGTAVAAADAAHLFEKAS